LRKKGNYRNFRNKGELESEVDRGEKHHFAKKPTRKALHFCRVGKEKTGEKQNA